MGDRSKISWTDATWNCLIGCSRVSGGCRHCYAERDAIRMSGPGQKYEGIVKSTKAGPRWTGKVRLVESALPLPLRWQRPRRIFVNSMSDLHHERVNALWLRAIYAVMWAAGRHTFQVLTKRPERMRAFMNTLVSQQDRAGWLMDAAMEYGLGQYRPDPRQGATQDQPLLNVWLGVSVEDQATADERIPILLKTPAAVRWISYEPALGPIDLNLFKHSCYAGKGRPHPDCEASRGPKLNWVVIGGESGPGARPLDLDWVRSAIAQCRVTGVPVFVKQLGARPWWNGTGPSPAGHVYLESGVTLGDQIGWRLDCLHDRKGADPAEWPEDIRVQEYPA